MAEGDPDPDPVAVLDRAELFANLPADLLATARARATCSDYARGDVICRQHDRADRLYVVAEGRVAISARSAGGREAVLAILGPPALFGELPLFDGGPRSADARALTSTRLVEVRFDDVRPILAERPEALSTMVRLLTRRLRITDEALADATFLDVPGRTAKRLLELAGSDDTFTVPITQEELAGMVGATRERVNKAIATFMRLGWLEVTGRARYTILDRGELEARARP